MSVGQKQAKQNNKKIAMPLSYFVTYIKLTTGCPTCEKCRVSV